MVEKDFGELTERQSHRLDCLCYDVFDKVYMLDPQPNYQIEKREGKTVLICENGFESYLSFADLIL